MPRPTRHKYDYDQLIKGCDQKEYRPLSNLARVHTGNPPTLGDKPAWWGHGENRAFGVVTRRFHVVDGDDSWIEFEVLTDKLYYRYYAWPVSRTLFRDV